MEWIAFTLMQLTGWSMGEKPARLRLLGLNLIVAIAVTLATSKYANLPMLSSWLCAGLSLLLVCIALVPLNIAVGRSLRDKG